MKTKMKALTLALCAVMLVATTVFATVAFLTSTTETVENTFTVGNVRITLDEEDTDDASEELKTNFTDTDITYTGIAQRDLQNEYKLLPGVTYVKDPTVHVKAESEPSYIRMMVTVTYPKAADSIFATNNYINWFNIDQTKWVPSAPVTTESGDNIIRTYEFRYYTVVDTLNNSLTTGSYNDTYTIYTEGAVLNEGKTSTVTAPDAKAGSYFDLEPLFTQISVPGAITNDQLSTISNVEIDIEAHAIQAAGFADANTAWNAFTK